MPCSDCTDPLQTGKIEANAYHATYLVLRLVLAIIMTSAMVTLFSFLITFEASND
ncbi:hypothetical protein BDW72DRAFT_172999 [Aspergillus terricola var. indicus]